VIYSSEADLPLLLSRERERERERDLCAACVETVSFVNIQTIIRYDVEYRVELHM
jgi:hypothetical protein